MARRYTLQNDRGASRYRIDYAAELNDEQLEAVTAGPGPMLVIAGAGSGKTRTLTYRVARLIESGTPADAILLLTFTNRAAREMMGRVEALLGKQARGVWGGTFHSIGRRLLRRYAERLGYPSDFTIIDREDGEGLMKQCIEQLDVDRTERRFPRPGVLVDLLSTSLNTERSVDEVLADRWPMFADDLDAITDALMRYQRLKGEYGVLDFDDLLVQWRRLLLDHEDVRFELTRRFEHVLVDEYQDTNRVQAELVDVMASGHGNLMVVGDDCQSIYSFRGADFRNILQFPDRHADCRRVMLTRNYRSTPEILGLANASIANNEEQFDKALTSERASGLLPALVYCRDDEQQAQFVAQRLLELRDEGVPLEQIAVLYRAHWQSIELQVELDRRRITYIVRSGMRFFEQRHVKDVLAFLRLALNPRDELSVHRVLGLARGIGPSTAAKLSAALRQYSSLGAALADPGLAKLVPSRARAGFARVAATLGEVAVLATAEGNTAAVAIDAITRGFYAEHARDAFDNSDNRLREIETLATWADQHGEVRTFLDSLALSSGASGVDVAATAEPDEHVILSTVHQAKGLEFDAVFVLWLAEDRFPLARSSQTAEELEEERRLFYVATTRARRDLYLSAPLLTWDRREGRVVLRPSPFITELSEVSPAPWERWDLVAE